MFVVRCIIANLFSPNCQHLICSLWLTNNFLQFLKYFFLNLLLSFSHFTSHFSIAVKTLPVPKDPVLLHISIHTILRCAAMHHNADVKTSLSLLCPSVATERYKSRTRSRNVRCSIRDGKYTTMSRDNRGEAAASNGLAVSNLAKKNLRAR